MLQKEAERYKKGLEEIEAKLLLKDTKVAKMETKLQNLEEEIDRRKFLESKVQTYVRSLIDQNEKCKNFIRTVAPAAAEQGDLPQKAKVFLHDLDTSPYDEHDGQSTENEEEEDDEEAGEADEAEEVADDAEENEDVAISDI